jgi:CRISPR-associated protein Cas5d
MQMSIKIEVWGPYACFTRPEMHTERVSYEIITPSAARGLIESIYYHPGLCWHIDRIYLMNPIRFTSVRRNEVKSTVLGSSVLSVMKNGGTLPAIYTAQDIQQRAALMLQDVHYVIEAHFTMTEKAAPGDNPGKFQDITRRRLERGQCYSTPYFGCRECPAAFREWPGGEIPAQPVTQDLGYMLYDMIYTDPKNIRPQFFRAKLENGVLDLRDCEVIE